jgi:DNA-binding MarR family transcriptional regulator
VPSTAALLEKTIFTPSNKRYQPEELKQLLAGISVIQNGCDLDLLVFLSRHPRTLLTNEQIAAFVGYDMKQVAQSLEAFIEAGLLERIQNPMHAARMYLLELKGPQTGGFKKLLDVAFTREGRRAILDTLKSRKSGDAAQLRHSQLVKSACA